jgi:hypothetical protein
VDPTGRGLDHTGNAQRSHRHRIGDHEYPRPPSRLGTCVPPRQHREPPRLTGPLKCRARQERSTASASRSR